MTAPQAPTCLGDLLRRAARNVPDQVALIGAAEPNSDATDEVVSWAQLDARVTASALAFARDGLLPGDRLVLVHPTSVRFVVDYLGALRAGLVAVPVNPAYTLPELGHVLTDCGAAGLVTSGADLLAQADALRALSPQLRVVLGSDPDGPGAEQPGAELPGAELPGAEQPDPGCDRRGDDVAVLLYTSGTSGQPRGAMLPARALLANLAQVAAVEPALVRPGDVALLALPLFHVFGLNGGFGVALWHAMPSVLMRQFNPRWAAELIARHHITVTIGAPPMYAAWAARVAVGEVFADVRLALSGAASLPAALVAEFLSHGVALYEGYGMTEAAPVLTLNVIGHHAPKAGSIGRPLPGIEVRLLDPDGDPVDEGDPGQLTVRGDNLFAGYWPDGAGAPVDGWFSSGDIAVRDADGDLWLVGRTSDLVIVNGFNVYPAEVEAVIGALPGVAEVAVIGHADRQTGETVQAFVVALPGAQLDAAVVTAGAARSLARYKVPTSVDIVDVLPHTVTGKVQKWRLRQSAAV